MINNDNQNNKKWIPYFKRENSIYKKQRTQNHYLYA